jgi:AcrR family transcriptional regulator
MTVTTKDKILNTAERLFADRGFDATSLRHIVAEAEVNLAAVHYHFHSKDALLDAVILRKLKTVNDERMALLDRFEREAGGRPAPVEQVLEAFIAPTFAVKERHPQFVRLMGRLHAEGFMLRLMRDHFRPVLSRFLEAFYRSSPEMEKEEVLWRIHFMVGAMAHTARGRPELHEAAGMRPTFTAERVSQSLVDFLAAGFRAPVPAAQEK